MTDYVVTPPKMFQHVEALFTVLSDASENSRWSGSMVAAFRELEVSQGYYSKLYDALKEMGCIEVLVAARGGGRASEIVLHKPPTPEEFEGVYLRSLTKPKEYDTLRQRVERLEGRVDTDEVLMSYHQRIESLETQVADLVREVEKLGEATENAA